MRFAIMYGKDDCAGINIINQLKSNYFLPQTPIIKLKKHPIFLNSSDLKELAPQLNQIDFIIIPSIHNSEKKQPSLSLHAPGNWKNADLGGKSNKISMTSSFILKYLFKELNKNSESLKNKYEITLECTHHGPSIDIPCCFIEIGSSNEYWNDKQAGNIIAKTIASLQNYKSNKNYLPVIGIGGPHYCPSFNKIQLNSEYAISHILLKYQSPITPSMIQEAEQKTKEQIKEVLIDWKSFNSEQRNNLLDILKKLDLKYKTTSNIEK